MHGYSIKILPALSDSLSREVEDKDESDGKDKIYSLIKEQISKTKPLEI
jgi:hypothetical protein